MLSVPDAPIPEEKRSAWWQQAERWREPSYHETCCGTTFGAMTPESLDAMLRAHFSRHGAGAIRDTRLTEPPLAGSCPPGAALPAESTDDFLLDV